MTMRCSLPVFHTSRDIQNARSRRCRKPTSNLRNAARFAGGISGEIDRPSDLLSLAHRSVTSSTWMYTSDCRPPSENVETLGSRMVVFFSITLVMTPARVQSPRTRGSRRATARPSRLPDEPQLGSGHPNRTHHRGSRPCALLAEQILHRLLCTWKCGGSGRPTRMTSLKSS